MKKSIFLIALTIVTTLVLSGQGENVLLTIADEQVTLDEFERIYRKNNSDAALNKQTPEEYLELYINFKLKVKEAESLGMDTTRKFINELEGYRAQLAKPYLTDDETKEKILREAYERAKTDINASHILIKMPPYPTPEDTLAAYEKISGIRERILNGEDFEKVAKATSDDASVQKNGGNLNYFTVFSMIYPFETVAYNTPLNTLSEPFRSNYGYHILKVLDRRPARGQVKVAHIFVRKPEGMDEAEKKSASEKVQMIVDSLDAGVDFSHLARTYSEDPRSAKDGGEIPWFGTGRMIPEFEEACFSIKNKGDITEPFESSYGWHIIKLLDKKGIGTFEEMKPELEEKVNRGERGKFKKDLFIADLKKEYNYNENSDALEKIYPVIDSTVLEGKWEGGVLKEDETLLLTIGEHTATVGELVSYIETNQRRRKLYNHKTYVDAFFREFSDDVIMKYEESRLPEKYPDFKNIYDEYHDGILLFDIMDQKVWSKAVSDTIGLKAFHQDHLNDYMWQERYEATLITCKEGVDANAVLKKSKKIMKGKLDEAGLNEKFCSSDTIPCITMTDLLVEKGENEMVDELNGKTGAGPVHSVDGKSTFVILKDIRSPEPKELNEARGQITSDYQNFLEEEWIKELKQKYPVKVNKTLLSRIKS